VERNRKAGQNPPRVVAPTEEEEEEVLIWLINCVVMKWTPLQDQWFLEHLN